MFSYEEIKELVKLLSENKLGEIEIKSANGDSISIKGQKTEIVAAGTAAPTAAAAPVQTAETTAPAETAPAENVKTFDAPIVGTFYSAPDPESEAFIKEGSQVRAGDTVCIIEAMKIMNEVNAESDFTVKKILVKNGDPVEYGQPLFIYE
jgi:acetyl-CoA carboxylase biotin carboxyl carrier protein